MRGGWNKRTKQEVKTIVNKLHYTLIKDYFNKIVRRVVIKDNFGYKYDVDLSSLIRNRKKMFIFVNTLNPFSLKNISLWLNLNNKKFKLHKDNAYKGSKEKLLFTCSETDCKEVFSASWSNISQGGGCPYCVGRKVGKHNNLAYKRPDLVRDWDYELNKISPYDVTEGSRERAFWKCKTCSYKWVTNSIGQRTKGKSGCPKCARKNSDSKISTELKHYILNKYNSEDEHIMLKNPNKNQWLKCDIYIWRIANSNNGVYIEVHGEQHYKLNGWHVLQSKKTGRTPEEEFKHRKYLDKIKKKFAQKHGTYIEVDLRKIKTTEQAIEYVNDILGGL